MVPSPLIGEKGTVLAGLAGIPPRPHSVPIIGNGTVAKSPCATEGDDRPRPDLWIPARVEGGSDVQARHAPATRHDRAEGARRLLSARHQQMAPILGLQSR